MEPKPTDQQTQHPEPKSSTEAATRPPLPPFTRETAIQKVRLAEDGWNSREPEKVALAYTIDSRSMKRKPAESGTTAVPNGEGENLSIKPRRVSPASGANAAT